MCLIFISYRRGDVPGHAAMLLNSLATTYTRERVFLDTSSIEIGETWSNKIQDAVSKSVVFLCVIGPDWDANKLHNPNDYVRREISAALSNGRPVIPMLFDGARYPAKEMLPDDCQALLDTQGVVFDPSDFDLYESKLKKLPSIIDGLIASSFATGYSGAICRLRLEGTSNRGEGGVLAFLDDGFMEYVTISQRTTHYLKFPIGWHTIKMSEIVTSVSRLSGFSSRSERTVASYRLFFEADEYVARIERYQPPWPFMLYDRYKFHKPVKQHG
jgi:hypothetical protein